MHTISASYSATTNFAASNSSISQMVNPVGGSAVIASKPGPDTVSSSTILDQLFASLGNDDDVLSDPNLDKGTH
jgi:hypothetical protein